MEQAKRIGINVVLNHGAVTKHARMEGSGFIEAGFLCGDFQSLRQSEWSIAERLLLCSFTFTGCPIAARTDRPEWNPWRWTDGAYKSHRTATLGTVTIRSSLVSESRGNDIEMTLEINYTGNLPQLAKVTKPFQEKISQLCVGKLEGMFDVEYSAADGSLHTLKALTDYELPTELNALPAWRNITIRATDMALGMTQVEQIDLFHDINAANADLNSKLQAWH
jgi:hypothetical protein